MKVSKVQNKNAASKTDRANTKTINKNGKKFLAKELMEKYTAEQIADMFSANQLAEIFNGSQLMYLCSQIGKSSQNKKRRRVA